MSDLKNLPRRAVRAFGFSWQGLKAAFIKEEALRLETLGLIILALILAVADWPPWKKAALLAVYTLIPLAELFNSAIEDLADLISPDYNELAGQAKDKGSAAVLLAMVVNLISLAALLFSS